jgi:hypothetical protein
MSFHIHENGKGLSTEWIREGTDRAGKEEARV